MLGIVIGTHGTFSDGLKDSAEVIMGAVNNIETVNLKAGEDVQDLGAKLQEAIKTVDKGKGVVVLVDLVSASPYNQSVIAISQVDKELQKSVYVIGGVNLPMLLETINHQMLDTPVEEIAAQVIKQGSEGLGSWHISDLDNDGDDDDDDDF